MALNRVTIQWLVSEDCYSVKFPWHRGAVGDFRAEIPEARRKYDPKTKTYYVAKAFVGIALEVLTAHFGKAQIDFTPHARWKGQSMVRGTMPASAMSEFCLLVGKERLKRAYREAATDMHPDRGGSHGEFTRLNNLWTRVQEELG